MPASNPLDILLRHDRWATRQILDECATLSPEQFNQKFEMGFGSLHATMTHILAAQRVWSDVLAGRESTSRLDNDGIQRTPAELIALQDEIASEFIALAYAHPLEATVSRVRHGKTHSFTRGAVLSHVATHAMHHRAQCLNMLRHLGITPLPPTSVIEWTYMGDAT